MTTQIKITQLTNIGSANTTVTTLLPVVNMAGTPTTQKTTLGNLANVILSQSGGNYAPANLANISYSVSNAAQPNITSVGTLTNVAVSGNATINGNITANGTAYLGNISTTGLASITTLAVGATANLGAVANVKITGGTSGYVLQTDGAGNLTWAAGGGGGSSYGNSDVANFLPTFSSANIGNATAGLGVNNLNMAGNIVATTQNMNVNWGSYRMFFNQTGSVDLNANLRVNANISNANVITANFFSGDGSNLTNVTVDTGDINFNGANISTNTANANISINGYGPDAHIILTSNSLAWTFEPFGTLDFPDGSRFGPTDGPNAVGFDVNTGDKFIIQTTNGANANAVYSWQFTPEGAMVMPDQNPGQASIISYSGGNTNVASFISFVTPVSSNLVLGTTSNNHVVINTDKANANIRWSFDDSGTLNFPGGTIAVDDIEGTNNFGFEMPTGVGFGILTNAGDNEWAFGSDGNLTLPNNAKISISGNTTQFNTCPNGFLGLNSYDAGSNNIARVNISSIDELVSIGLSDPITENDYNWTFDITGNLTLPGNTFAVNYANGDQVNISGGSGNTGNVTFDNINVIGTGNLNLQPDPANSGSYLDIFLSSGPDIHIVASASANLILGKDNQSNVMTSWDGNVYIQSWDNNTNTQGGVWAFDGTGNLGLPGGGSIYGNPYTPSGAPGNTITLQPAGSGITTNQKLMIYPTAADGDHIHMTTGNLYETELFLGSDNFYAKLANTGDIVLHANTGLANATWTFSANSSLILPGAGVTMDAATNALLTSGIANTTIGTFVQGADGGVSWEYQGEGGNANTSYGAVGLDTAGTANTANLQFKVQLVADQGNVSTNKEWIFDTDGNLTAPGNIVIDDGVDGNVTSTGNINITSNNKAWTFGISGNLTLPGNTFAVNYANGTQVSIGGGGSYGDSNVVTLLGSFGSNTITTTGNANVGNIGATAGVFTTVTGNLTTAIQSNVTRTGTLDQLIVANTVYADGYGARTGSDLTISTAGNGNLIISPAGTGIVNFSGKNISNIGNANVGNVSATGNITANGVGTNMVRRANTIGGSNTTVTLDNITALLGGTPTRLFIGAASSNMTMAGTSQTMTSGSMAVSSWINVPIVTGTGNGFAMSGAVSTNGDTVVLNVTDQGAGSGMWRVTGIIANTSANLYSVSIERLA